jgi:hypothetical protein
MMTDEVSNLVDKEALCVMLSVCKRTIDNLLARGMPHRNYAGVRFCPTEVRQWIDANYRVQRRRAVRKPQPPTKQRSLAVQA